MAGYEGLFDLPEAISVQHRATLFDGRVWGVEEQQFDFNGSVIRREVIDHPGAVAVMALDEEDRFIAIRQYRHPVRLRDWEIPAGLLDVDEEHPHGAAQRELAEEVDLVAGSWQVLCDFTTSPGGSNEIVRIYVARDLATTDQPFARDAEEADMEQRWISLDEAYHAVINGQVSNSIFIIAVLQAHAARELHWTTLRPADAPWPLKELRDQNAAR